MVLETLDALVSAGHVVLSGQWKMLVTVGISRNVRLSIRYAQHVMDGKGGAPIQTSGPVAPRGEGPYINL